MRGEWVEFFFFFKGEGCVKVCARISPNRILNVGFDSNWVNDGDNGDNDGDNQRITPMLVPLLVTSGSEMFHSSLLSHAVNELQRIAK